MLAQKSLAACAIALVVTLALMALACGGSSTSHTLSQAQAQAVSREFFTALGSALSAGLTPPVSSASPSHPSIAAALQHVPELQSQDCTVTNNGQSCNIPINYQGNCPNGGTIAVTGDFIFTLDSSGNGSDSATLTMTPSNCTVDNETFNGDPNVQVTTGFVLKNNALDYPITFSESGGISFGPNPSGSCTLNVSINVTSPTTCTATGSVCGHSVSGQC